MVQHGMRIDARELGRRGERRACWFYRLRGYRIVGTNVRLGRGELDLIARRGHTLVIAEVKTRQSRAAGEGWEAVGRAKQLQLIDLATRYTAPLRDPQLRIRFDVLSLFWTGRRFEITYFEDAFRPVADAREPWRWGCEKCAAWSFVCTAARGRNCMNQQMLTRQLAVVVASITLFAASAAQAQTKGLGPNLLGMSTSAVKPNIPTFNCNAFGSLVPAGEKWCKGYFYAPRMPEMNAVVKFENDKAVSYRVWYPVGEYSRMRSILTARFGEPKETKTRVLWTDAGQKLDSEDLTWSGPDAVITSEQFVPYGDGLRASITIETPARHESQRATDAGEDAAIAKAFFGD